MFVRFKFSSNGKSGPLTMSPEFWMWRCRNFRDLEYSTGFVNVVWDNRSVVTAVDRGLDAIIFTVKTRLSYYVPDYLHETSKYIARPYGDISCGRLAISYKYIPTALCLVCSGPGRRRWIGRK